MPPARALRAVTLAAASLVVSTPALVAQEEVRLSAGDSIRVDGEIVGRVLSITGPTMTVVSREAPRCRAGRMHGDAPICDPAPLVRHSMSLDEVVVERRLEKPNLALRTIAGGVLGAAAFGAIGYFIGPEIGFGEVEGCVDLEDSSTDCATGEPRFTAEELASRQKSADQTKGAFFFGVIGGTATAILVKKLSVGWVQIQPVIAVGESEPWGLEFSLPAPR